MRREYGRKLYSLPEFYRILYLALRTAKYLSRAKRHGCMTTQLVERIMLAVTEVNQCPLCSYGHTKMALEAGMSSEEIQNLLSHSLDTVPEDEIAAVLFAQHYADSRADPSMGAWRRVVDVYGEEKAKGILGAVRMIMFGNAFGIVLSSIKGRFRGKPDPRSNAFYEVSMVFALLLFLPVALIHALISEILRVPVIR